MNCADFEEKLDQLHEGHLSLPDEHAAICHLEECCRCRGLFAASHGENQGFGSDSLEGLADSILERTSGSACTRARAHLCDFVDGSLDNSYIPLVMTHLEHCLACKRLADQLAELKQIMPAWAEIDPGHPFLPGVLRTTSRHSAGIRANWQSARRLWQHLIGRPRIGWEAAYAATLIFVVLAGNPALSMGSAFLAGLGNTRMDPGVGLQAAMDSLPAQWIETGNRTVLGAQKQASNILALRQQFPPAINRLERTCEKWIAVALQYKKRMLHNLSFLWSNAAVKARHLLNPMRTVS